MYTWQVRIEGVFRRHVARSDYRFEIERTERMRNMPYMQVVNLALYSSKLINDYRFEMERTVKMRNIPYMQVVN